MIMKRRFLLVILLCWPFVSMATVNTSTIDKATSVDGAATAAQAIVNSMAVSQEQKTNANNQIQTAKAEIENAECASCSTAPAPATTTTTACPDDSTGTHPNCTCNDEDKRFDKTKNACVEDELKKKQKAYEDAKANEQSTANKTLTALTTAATGIGGMELARGLSEQKADKDAANSMAAYIATMRCTYADGKQVKAGPDEIELPGGSNQQLMNLRAEYFALAADLKERKTALGMKPGIESEEILDKAATGLYDDETKGIDSGAYASLYRAQMLGSDVDQEKIDAEQKASKNRVIAGAVVGGVGVVGGVVGNSLINGKLGEMIKENKNCKSIEKLYNATNNSLTKLKSCLKTAGATGTDELAFNYFQADWLSLSGIKCKDLLSQNTQKDKTAKNLFLDSNSVADVERIVTQLKQSFGDDNVKIMLGASSNEDSDLQQALKAKIEKRASEYQDAMEQDEKSGCNSSFLDGVKTGIIDGKNNS